ncbi:MAG TPA: tetratricopeptide repeat protein, partial [Chthonomonadales bacterium]|nr:tetratricopeptide repeat protein [Chthonomonadales bacterium]
MVRAHFAAMVAMLLMTPAWAQPAQTPAAGNAAQAEQAKDKTPARKVTGSDRRRATKLYLRATKLFEKQKYDEAMQDYEEAAELDPGNVNYSAATEVARSHKVTELIQTAAKARIRGDRTAEQAALQKAAALDPHNIEVAVHLDQMADDVAAAQTKAPYEQGADSLAPSPVLEPTAGTHSFHLKSDRRTIIQNVYRSFGIEASVDQSVTGAPVRFDMDDATFVQATQAVNLATDSFTVPLDAHRALVAKDTRENRQQYMR